MASLAHTITTGIQDIAALLPLLGTEQCEDHVGSALTDGFLYVTATPMSIFGSLGIVKAAFKGLLASISIQRWEHLGAETLRSAGFKPSGKNLELIMMDPNNPGCHLAESRLDVLLEQLHIDDIDHLNIAMQATGWRSWSKVLLRDARLLLVRNDKKLPWDLRMALRGMSMTMWNLKIILSSIIFCLASLTAYIELITNSRLPYSTCLAFPILRALGSFLAAISLQILIQRRLDNLLQKRRMFHILDPLVKAQILDHSPDNELRWDRSFSSERCLWSLHNYLNPQIPEEKNVFRLTLVHYLRRNMARVRSRLRYGNMTGTSSTISPFRSGPNGPTSESVNPTHSTDPEGTILPNGRDSKLGDLKKLFSDMSKAEECSVTWPCLFAFLGIFGSVIGYVGCFSVVQGAKSLQGPLIWLSVEAALSLIRISLWIWNPKWDDAEPIWLSSTLSRCPPLPTCNKSAATIDADKILPLTRAPQFLQSIGAYVGLLEPFDYPSLTIFYTLTRHTHNDMGSHDRMLYITIYDSVERITRVYGENQDNRTCFMYADPPTFDLEYSTLQTHLKGAVADLSSDPILSGEILRSALQVHYHSILDQLVSQDKSGIRTKTQVVNDWTLKVGGTWRPVGRSSEPSIFRNWHDSDIGETISHSFSPEHFRSVKSGIAASVTEDNPADAINVGDVVYLKEGNFQRKARSILVELRQWIDAYTVTAENKGEIPLPEKILDWGWNDADFQVLADLDEIGLICNRLVIEFIFYEELTAFWTSLLDAHRKVWDYLSYTRGVLLHIPEHNRLKTQINKEWVSAASILVKAARYSSILSSNRWLEGNLHWQYNVGRLEDSWREFEAAYYSGNVTTRSIRGTNFLPVFGGYVPLGHLRWKEVQDSIQPIMDDFVRDKHVRPEVFAYYKTMEIQRHRRMQEVYQDTYSRLTYQLVESERFFRHILTEHYFERGSHCPAPKWMIVDCAFPGLTISNPVGELHHSSEVTFVVIYMGWKGPTDMSRPLAPEIDVRVARAVAGVPWHCMPQVTTILVTDWTGSIKDQTLSALLQVAVENPNIISISSRSGFSDIDRWDWNRQWNVPNRFTSMSFHDFDLKPTLSEFSGITSDSGSGQPNVKLQFVGPGHGSLMLTLRHRNSRVNYSLAPLIVTFSSVSNKIAPVSVAVIFPAGVDDSKNSYSQRLTLVPNEHFDPRSLNVITIIPKTRGYHLYDLDLLDEHGHRFTDPGDDDPMSTSLQGPP